MFSFKEAGMLLYRETSTGTSLDYTQLREHAASAVLR
jgi:hypothetical protein